MLRLTLKEIPEIVPEIDVIHSDDGTDFCYMFKDGIYKGVAYVYSDIKFEEPEKENEGLTIKFSYVILDNKNDAKIDENFYQTIGDILVKIIEHAVNN